MKFEYFLTKELHSQIQSLRKKGGQFQKASNIIADVALKISMGVNDPFNGMSLTNHGESRINHCIKYDLAGFCRLITIQNNGLCLLAYAGSHDECDEWLQAKKGMNLAIDPKTKQLVKIMMSDDISTPDKRISGLPDYSEGKLYKKIKSRYFNSIADLLKHSQLQPFLELESTFDDDEFIVALDVINDESIQTIFFDVFTSLKKGDVDAAKNRILEFEEQLKLVSQAEIEEVEAIISNDTYLKLNELEAEYLKTILENKNWFEWMLFLHPAQKEIVDQEYSGSSRLLGVSGSGKTCVLVHRAIRLAEKYPGEKLLILTINKSLSKLIADLVKLLLFNLDKTHLSQNIQISSFWELCKSKLTAFDDRKTLAHRMFNIKTDKYNESVDEIWEEFYQCKLNNYDAEVLFPLHQMLLARGIYPQEYLKEEFDWIRSAFDQESRDNYLKIEREGRFVPFVEEDRQCVLKGMTAWERKMADVGVIDYLGYANALSKYIDRIKPDYRCVLVDEIQDFGTIELKLIRKMVPEAPNDIFICGDIAQQVYNRHHKIRQAGITILPEGFVKILKNYRNSREILEAAYMMFKLNVNIEQLRNDDLEVLSPEFANFSSPKPFLREGISLQHEFNCAYDYLQSILDVNKKEKGCIAICGFTINDISDFAKLNNLRILDGEMDLSNDSIFISDLEQTKGFEFDRMIIVNCSKSVIPNPVLPHEEWFREVSKLYVAMTRAKKDLVLSYSKGGSTLFDICQDYFTHDKWIDHISNITSYKFTIIDKKTKILSKVDSASLSGKDLMYHRKAVGISRELQNKLIEFVAGKTITDERGKKIGWTNLALLQGDLNGRKKDIPTLSRIFGPVVYQELEKKLS